MSRRFVLRLAIVRASGAPAKRLGRNNKNIDATAMPAYPRAAPDIDLHQRGASLLVFVNTFGSLELSG